MTENEIKENLISLLDERMSLGTGRWIKEAIEVDEPGRLETLLYGLGKVPGKKDDQLGELLEELIKKMKARLKIETSSDFIP